MLAPVQFNNRSLADPHTGQTPAQTAALLEESIRIGDDTSEWRGECPENGALEALSHGTFLHVARYTRRRPSQFHYISRDHPNAHELTNHIRHPSPEPGLWSPGAPGKWWRRWCGIVPNWYKRQFSHDTLNQYYIQNRIFVVKLVYNPRTN